MRVLTDSKLYVHPLEARLNELAASSSGASTIDEAYLRNIHHKLFSNVSTLLGYNQVLLEDMTRAAYEWPRTSIHFGEIFLKVLCVLL